MRRQRTYLLVVGAVVLLAGGAVVVVTALRPPVQTDKILALYRQSGTYSAISVVYPLDETVFPPEITAPTFRWKDSKSDVWVIAVRFEDGGTAMSFASRRCEWTPRQRDWEIIKTRSSEKPAQVTILGVSPPRRDNIVSAGQITITTSKDKVGAPIFYREVNLPFVDTVKDPSKIRWRFGSIASAGQPPVVLENMPVCGNCHSFPSDGKTLAMDVDYANSKGSYVITRVAEQMILATSDIVTWNDYRKEDGEQTFGLLSQISPDGRYIISTVKDKSVFVPMPGLAFSQLFFPIKGILCVYDREKKAFASLPGADDPNYVQSNPSWSPDGKYVVFARAKAYDLENTKGKGKILLTREECKEFTEDGKPFLFDLYRLPFNEGNGGTPEPVEGASNNGMSNFFAKYSPDGKWIVFCKAKSYMLLQGDSELHIIPAEGGRARRLRCNTSRMNSWHSWSPNSRWLVFASKAYTDYTQLFLTHIDEQGNSSPAVLLANFTAADKAANIPEFVNASQTGIKRIHEQFLNDYSFVRAGNEFYRHGEPDNAIEEYRNALRLNPNNVEAHQKLGFLLYHVKGRDDEGMEHLRKTLELDPTEPRAHYDLGMALLHQQKLDEAIVHLSEAAKRAPQGIDEQYNALNMSFHLGESLLRKGRTEESAAYLSRVIAIDPNHAQAHYRLALVLAEQGKIDETLEHYRRAVQIQPAIDTFAALHHLLGRNYAQAGQYKEAVQCAEKALRLARAAGDTAMAQLAEQWLQVYKQTSSLRGNSDN